MPAQVTIHKYTTISYVAIGITHAYYYVNYNDNMRLSMLAI